MDIIKQYLSDLHETLDLLSIESIQQVIDTLYNARIGNKQVFIMGNGGSASTASHFVCDLSKNTRVEGTPHFRVIGLTDNMALFSALANDEGYDQVFTSQLASLLRPDDIVIGISTSGNSPNVVKGIKFANSMNAETIGFTGFDGGKLAKIVDLQVHVPSNCIEQVEDIHLMLEHLICTALKNA
jgi:D-sedoheptulose 7-phosphate isomerase